MENISKKDIKYRLSKIKDKANEITLKIDNNNEEINKRFKFVKNLGLKLDDINNNTDEIKEGLNNYIEKVNSVLITYENIDDSEERIQEYKLLNNILYLDDIKLKNINELINENKELATKEFINMVAGKANDLIREEEIKALNINIAKYSKVSLIEKIMGKSKVKKAMLENYTLKRMQTMNKKYIPEDKSLYEIVSIANNCGYKSENIDLFISSIVNEFKLEKPSCESLISLKEEKIPIFFNKDYISKINAENAVMLDQINSKKQVKQKVSEYKMYNDILKNDIATLELLNFNNIIEEVI